MDPAWAIGIVVTVALTTIGWLVARSVGKDQVISTQATTINALERQVLRMEITAELTNKIMERIPPSTPGGTK